MNVEEFANGCVNAFNDMAKAASEFGEACSIAADSMQKQVVSIQLAYIEKLTDKVNKACFLTRWYYTRKLFKEIGKLDELVSSFYPSVPRNAPTIRRTELKHVVMKTKELKTKTVFDFSNYPAIIEEITGTSIKDSNRVEYYKKTCHPINKARDIEYLAYKIGDKQLEVAASSFAAELERERDEENGKAMKKGYIID